MSKRPSGAVAVDLGATSARSALGWINDEGALEWHLVEQVPHGPLEVDGRLRWDLEQLLGVCQRAVAAAQASFERSTWGIDTWGVDFGLVDEGGRPLELPVCYRDRLHEVKFEEMILERERLYALTGIQHQPFNSLYQLATRPPLPGAQLRFLPDLLTDLTFGGFDGVSELTLASTSQLVGLDGDWCAEAFGLIGWDVPAGPIRRPGFDRGQSGNVTAVAVGSHDTASAVFGLAPAEDEAYLNVGTWSLLGCGLPAPYLGDPGFTNERGVEGDVRYLANIPGFYVLSRLHGELGLPLPLPAWLAEVEGPPAETVDLMDPRFFNPVSMVEAMRERLSAEPTDWAATGLFSLAQTTAQQLIRLEKNRAAAFPPAHPATARALSLKVGGGGAASAPLLQALRHETGRAVIAGPQEATLVGNLRFQLERAANG